MSGNNGVPRIGPNSLTQTVGVLRALAGEASTRALLRRGDMEWIIDQPPQTMVEERQFHALVGLLDAQLGPASAEVLRRAGGNTAHYLLQNRIPRLFQRLLRFLPAAPAARLLLAAISRNAWTFVGSGKFSYTFGAAPVLHIERTDQAADSAFAFYGGTFTTLLQTLVDPGIRLTEVVAHSTCGSSCTYHILRKEQPCVS